MPLSWFEYRLEPRTTLVYANVLMVWGSVLSI
jgi:hypothetical protein